MDGITFGRLDSAFSTISPILDLSLDTSNQQNNQDRGQRSSATTSFTPSYQDSVSLSAEVQQKLGIYVPQEQGNTPSASDSLPRTPADPSSLADVSAVYAYNAQAFQATDTQFHSTSVHMSTTTSYVFTAQTSDAINYDPQYVRNAHTAYQEQADKARPVTDLAPWGTGISLEI